jgi:hypothetical protein
LLLPGYQWSPVIGGSGYIGILNANAAILDYSSSARILCHPDTKLIFPGFQIGVREGARCL